MGTPSMLPPSALAPPELIPARRRSPSPASVVRVTEATGMSPRSWDAAVAAAVEASDAKDTIGVEGVSMWAECDGRKLSRHHVSVKVAFRQKLAATAR